ncbi:hypothetical protein B0H12DRAFT_1264895, partial [Mycena haematopus]
GEPEPSSFRRRLRTRCVRPDFARPRARPPRRTDRGGRQRRYQRRRDFTKTKRPSPSSSRSSLRRRDQCLKLAQPGKGKMRSRRHRQCRRPSCKTTASSRRSGSSQESSSLESAGPTSSSSMNPAKEKEQSPTKEVGIFFWFCCVQVVRPFGRDVFRRDHRHALCSAFHAPTYGFLYFCARLFLASHLHPSPCLYSLCIICVSLIMVSAAEPPPCTTLALAFCSCTPASVVCASTMKLLPDCLTYPRL